ncbi:flavodoxin domain-containing protein [Serratia bockelmannii]|uniref:flavodoxin domain-containing protein n=1 Tax=Serratia bockelmannii TaxID=2703793 RepID=UPI003F6C4CAC
MADIIERILIGYGSESGNARALAMRLGEQSSLQPYRPMVKELNAIQPADVGERDILLIVSSSFGDGEPPANAERFSDALAQWPDPPGCATPSLVSATPRTRISAASRRRWMRA